MSDLPPPPPPPTPMTDISNPANPHPILSSPPPGVEDKFAPEGRTWIILDESDEIPPTGLSLGVNGEIIMIMPGEPVNIPNRYIEVLDHAVQLAPQRDGGQRVTSWREKHRFPYRRVPAPVAA